jgi:uncharacterized membrane protein YkoI
MKLTRSVVAVLGVLAIGGASAALARESHQTDEAAIYEQVKLTLADAIAAAERQTGGRAVEAKLENEHGVVAFEVEVMKDRAFQKVVIDAKSGQIVKAGAADRGDDEEDGENDDD